MDETSKTNQDALKLGSQLSAFSHQLKGDEQLSANSGQGSSGGEAGSTSMTSFQQSAVGSQLLAGENPSQSATGGQSPFRQRESNQQKTYTEADVQKLISDAKAEAGRRIKTLETEASAFKAQAETLEAARNKEIEELAVYRRQKLIDETAAKFGVNAKLLDKPYIESQEQLEDLAKTLQAAKSPTGTPGNIQPDSGMTSGGGADLKNMSAGDLIKRGLEKRNR